MICGLHPSEGEIEECPACKNNNPPDLGVEVQDDLEVGEEISGS